MKTLSLKIPDKLYESLEGAAMYKNQPFEMFITDILQTAQRDIWATQGKDIQEMLDGLDYFHRHNTNTHNTKTLWIPEFQEIDSVIWDCEDAAARGDFKSLSQLFYYPLASWMYHIDKYGESLIDEDPRLGRTFAHYKIAHARIEQHMKNIREALVEKKPLPVYTKGHEVSAT